MSRSSIDLAECLNQNGRSPFQHREIPTAEQPQRTQDRSPHESDGQRGAVPETTTDQKKGILDKMDFRKSFNYQYSDDSTFHPEQRARLPHLFANRESAEAVSYTHLTLPTKA